MMPGSAAPNSLPDYLRSVMDRLILEPPQGEGLAFDGTQALDRPGEGLFALCLGPQWLDRWSGANACVLVPGVGGVGPGPTGSALKTLQSVRKRVALFSLLWSIEIHVWGRDPGAAVLDRDRDVERYREAFQIFENVSRVLYVSSSGYGLWSDNRGFNQETPINRYGEAIVATFMVPVSIYDYPHQNIAVPQQLTPASGQPAVESPGGPS
jgi:hypothetical protein